MKNQPLSEGKIHGKPPTILEGKRGKHGQIVIFHQPGFSSNKRVPFPFIAPVGCRSPAVCWGDLLRRTVDLNTYIDPIKIGQM